jgi:biotin synthase
MNENRPSTRHDWTLAEVQELYEQPLPELLFKAQTLHREFHDPCEVQVCSLLSIKTGGCAEDCAYCPQSAHHEAAVEREPLLSVDQVLNAAKKAHESGASRFCMGAAWREVSDGEDFDKVLEMVTGVRELGMEACCTLGMITPEQAGRLAEAGLSAYNHNLDTGPEYYDKIITTRTYQDRLDTIENVRNAGITVCCGGIIGMGESISDRLDMLCVLSGLDPHPESVPINALMAIEGTPLENQEPIDALEMVRTIACARIMMPSSMVRLSAGRVDMSTEAQALCFLAGANSIFAGEKLLTAANPSENEDEKLLDSLGMRPRTDSATPVVGES